MPSTDIRVDYRVLEEIATTFGNESERVERMYSQLDTSINTLKNGGWVSDAADTFYGEMERDMLPSVERLAKALAQAADTTLQIKTIFKSAEEEAAAYLRADDQATTDEPTPSEKDDGRHSKPVFQEIPPIIIGEGDPLGIFESDGEPISLPFSITGYSEAEFDQAVADYLTQQINTGEAIDWGWFAEHQPTDTAANNAVLSSLLATSSSSQARAVPADGGGWLAALIALLANNPGWWIVAMAVAASSAALQLIARTQQSQSSTLFSQSNPNDGDDSVADDGQSGDSGAAAGQTTSPGYTDGSGYRVDPETGQQVVDPQNLPADPNDLLQHGWQEVTDPRAIASPTYNGRREFIDPQTGQRVSFEPGRSGAQGWEGRDHYHVYNPNSTSANDLYLDLDGNPVRRGSRASHIPLGGN